MQVPQPGPTLDTLALPCMHQGDHLDSCWICICTDRYIHCLVGGSLAWLLWPAWPALQVQVIYSDTECCCSGELLNHPTTKGPQSTGRSLFLPVSPHSCTLPCGFLVRPVPAGETSCSAMQVTALVQAQRPTPWAILQNAVISCRFLLVASELAVVHWLSPATFLGSPRGCADYRLFCAVKTLLSFPVGDAGG